MRERKIYETMPDKLLEKLADFGRDFSAARRARNLSQGQLADQIDVARQTVIRLEKGDDRVSFGTYVAGARVMGMQQQILSAFEGAKDAVRQREARLNLKRRIHQNRAAEIKAAPAEPISEIEQFGQDISAARRARVMSQEQLADRMNVGRRTVIRMEKGDDRISFGAIATAAWVMGLDDQVLSAFCSKTDPVQQANLNDNLHDRIAGRRGPITQVDNETPEPVSASDNELDF